MKCVVNFIAKGKSGEGEIRVYGHFQAGTSFLKEEILKKANIEGREACDNIGCEFLDVKVRKKFRIG